MSRSASILDASNSLAKLNPAVPAQFCVESSVARTRAALFRRETVETVPAADVENSLVGKTDFVEFGFYEAPQPAMRFRIRRLDLRSQSVTEVEFVIPMDSINPLLNF